MRLEIIIPDTTRPELKAKLASLTRRLSERPELVEELETGEDEAIQRMFTPERLAHIARAKAEIDAGHGLTLDQLDSELAANKAEWLLANPD